ncbi:MAG: hypothetical protein QGG84_04535, partial [Rhodospirillales bacterium]|nr:hypothetical protein [Rhodospirillales bacterium]
MGIGAQPIDFIDLLHESGQSTRRCSICHEQCEWSRMENLKSIETDLCTSVITGSQNSPVMSGCGRLARLHRKNNLFQRKG